MLENHGPDAVLGTGTWLGSPARLAAEAVNAYGETHPSLGNYLAMLSGDNQGVDDDDVTHGPFDVPTLVGQLERAHVSWTAYMDVMPAPCFGRTSDVDLTGDYAKRHNPFMFFTEVTQDPALCAAHVVPGARLAADLRKGLPRFVWITPDMCEDMHDCSVADGQAWMARTLPAVLRALGPKGILFVTADEGTDDAHGGGHIPLVALGGGARPGAVLRTRVDHRSLLATVEDVLGLGRLAATKDVPTLRALLSG